MKCALVTHHAADLTLAAFFSRRAGDARLEDLHAVLALAPDREPEFGDEVPDGVPQA